MKIRITLLIITCAVLTTSLITGSTMAWFFNSTSKEIVFETGSIKFTITGELVGAGERENEDDYVIVVPGQFITDMGGSMFLTNESNIDTELRMQIVYNHIVLDDNGDEVISPDIVYDPKNDTSLDQYMDFTLHNQWIFVDEKVSDKPEDGSIKCFSFKYDNSKEDEDPTAYTLPKINGSGTGDEISLLEGISFSGEKITAAFSGSFFSLKLIFLVKQKNIVQWQELGAFVFNVTT